MTLHVSNGLSVYHLSWFYYRNPSWCVVPWTSNLHKTCCLTVQNLRIVKYVTAQYKAKTVSLSYAFFWVIPWHLNFVCRHFGCICRRFGTLYHPMVHPNTRPISFTYMPMASIWVITLHSLFLYSDLPLLCHPPSYWLRLFSNQTFSRINIPTFSTPVILHTYLPMKMEQTECSEMSGYKIQTPGNYLEESIQHSEHGESLKSRSFIVDFWFITPSSLGLSPLTSQGHIIVYLAHLIYNHRTGCQT
jgi:hypothetical protein